MRPRPPTPRRASHPPPRRPRQAAPLPALPPRPWRPRFRRAATPAPLPMLRRTRSRLKRPGRIHRRRLRPVLRAGGPTRPSWHRPSPARPAPHRQPRGPRPRRRRRARSLFRLKNLYKGRRVFVFSRMKIRRRRGSFSLSRRAGEGAIQQQLPRFWGASRHRWRCIHLSQNFRSHASRRRIAAVSSFFSSSPNPVASLGRTRAFLISHCGEYPPNGWNTPG